MRRVLFDENMPRRLRRDLPGFEIRTVQDEGWSSLQNGTLLSVAQASFDVLVTADQRLQHQQNIPAYNIAVVVIVTRSIRYRALQASAAQIIEAIRSAQPGTVTAVSTSE